ncbi:MAG: deoxyribose-phosphate aldolase [Ignavibacteria bacterium]|nr:deoxyribose-phosphate aldolase [Ignavibacteria bacterium]
MTEATPIEKLLFDADEAFARWIPSGEAGALREVEAGDLARHIDHTLLKPDATEDAVTQLCAEAREAGFATVCVNPVFVPLSARLLAGSAVAVCTVIGFPLGASRSAVKAAETRQAAADGAAEFDMVLPVGLLLSGQYEAVRADIAAVVAAAREARDGAIVKVILETCLLQDRDIARACHLALDAGADYVKTSTGFSTGGATPRAVALMAHMAAGALRVKASGGIRTRADALLYLSLGADRIGTSSGLTIIQQ